MADAEMLNMLVKEYGADVWPMSYDGQWSARKLVNLVDLSDYDCPLELLEPPEDRRERIGCIPHDNARGLYQHMFCFKFFLHRNEMHETGHTFKRCTFFIESEDERSEHSGQDGEASDGEESDAFRAGSGSSGTEEADTETDDDDDDDD
ncbi:hypothetical protein NCS56_00661800 [Fusarium sp. Ph1]|nr:hypothetical protein NCS56_00661800 [Fusarium sp. Ph1]